LLNKFLEETSNEKCIVKYEKKDLPIIGTVSDVAGTFSATINMKTENATKQVKPRVTFSPEDVGNL
jgi:hypothetical protein